MGIREYVEGYDQFKSKTTELDALEGIKIVLFCGSKDPVSGKSWCPDCVEAQPVIDGALKTAPDDVHFLYVGVGPRDLWKDPKCPFRTDPQTRLTGVPTLLKWGTKERLVEHQCTNANLITMLWEELSDDSLKCA